MVIDLRTQQIYRLQHLKKQAQDRLSYRLRTRSHKKADVELVRIKELDEQISKLVGV